MTLLEYLRYLKHSLNYRKICKQKYLLFEFNQYVHSETLTFNQYVHSETLKFYSLF